MSIRSLPIEAKSALIPKLSKEQRTAFLDIDLWSKDTLSVNDFSQWLYVYSNVADEFKYEFIKSPEFALFLKARFNIWTFDVEDPQYPDHDFYFLTECNQLLFEYDENCEFVDQLKDSIKMLYSEEGVEKAYSYLFKIVSDQIGMMTEDEYRLKKNRLQDYGFVDYYEALELTNQFPTEKHILNYLNKVVSAKKYKTTLEDELKNQKIPYSLISTFERNNNLIDSELDKLNDREREDFLTFNLVKLVNANIEINGGIKKGVVELNLTSRETKTLVELGLTFIVKHLDSNFKDSKIKVFDIFTFTDMHKIGKTLVLLNQKMIKKSYSTLSLDEKFDSFLGNHHESLISRVFSREYKFTSLSGEQYEINDIINFEKLKQDCIQLCETLPFAKAFKDKLDQLKKDGQIQNHFYLNYNLQDIDFPALILSSFSNFYFNESLTQLKIGLTIQEFKLFLLEYNSSRKSDGWNAKIKSFTESFGLSGITNFNLLLNFFLEDALDGYENIDSIADDEFKFIGGPIILISN